MTKQRPTNDEPGLASRDTKAEDEPQQAVQRMGNSIKHLEEQDERHEQVILDLEQRLQRLEQGVDREDGQAETPDNDEDKGPQKGQGPGQGGLMGLAASLAWVSYGWLIGRYFRCW
ncbi:hypothetical protein M011DRAFT_466262 [Sporormia fimetaria CBS 119925]|uniref:Uncharacterized protein n=1 Tax=Sporormia fimetaria CBS 119925 TaxID=1340428 RepID=A0A6A6VHF4_9PLEO|nr:hypothetical protein M011DRAFT_466262 [Sporormia fimetaria CBS 119925]